MAFLVVFLITLLIYIVFPKKYNDYVDEYSVKYSVEKELCYSVIRCESGFSPNKISKKGAVGLMQVMPSTALWCCEQIGLDYDYELLKTPEYNVRIGIFYLSYLKERFDNVDDVIKAYNAGETVVRYWNKNNKSPYKETSEYLKKVKMCMVIYKLI